jgi:hypothetical protein
MWRGRMLLAAGVLALLTQGVFVLLGLRWKDWDQLLAMKPKFDGQLVWAQASGTWASVVVATHRKHFVSMYVNRWSHPTIMANFLPGDTRSLPKQTLPLKATYLFDESTDARRVRHSAILLGWPLRAVCFRATFPVAEARKWQRQAPPLHTFLSDDRGQGRAMHLLWWQTGVNLAVTWAGWSAVLVGPTFLIRRIRSNQGLCRTCRYDVRGLNICPECGEPCVKLHAEVQR